MNYVRRMSVFYLIYTGIGIIALLVALCGHLPDSSRAGWVSGIAAGLIPTGIIGAIISVHLMKNPGRAAEVELAKNEERTQMIRMKTNSATYRAMLYLESIGALAAGLLGCKELSIMLAVLLVAQVMLYLGFIAYYAKRY